jgi:two-component system LytT family response regulator
MKYYEEHLPPDLFIRVHRSFIVNVEQITRLKPYSKDNYVAVLRSGEKIPVSRAGYKMLRGETLLLVMVLQPVTPGSPAKE